jgi:hypothetical protein
MLVKKSATNEPIAGFFIQVRRDREDTEPLGRFEENIAEFRTRDCPNNLGRARPQNSLTHKSKEEKTM